MVQTISMIYGYARVSTDGQSVNAQVVALRKHGAGKVFREVASGATGRSFGDCRPRRDGDGRRVLRLPNSRAAMAWERARFRG